MAAHINVQVIIVPDIITRLMDGMETILRRRLEEEALIHFDFSIVPTRESNPL